MSVQLLDKTRKINKLLHNNNSSKVVFNDICDVLKDILSSNILVISKKGKVLGTGLTDGVEEIRELIVDEVGGFIDPLLRWCEEVPVGDYSPGNPRCDREKRRYLCRDQYRRERG